MSSFFLTASLCLQKQRKKNAADPSTVLLRTAGRQPITQQNSRSTCSLSPTTAQSRCPCGVPQKETFACLTGNAACAPPRGRRALKEAPARAPACGFAGVNGVMTTPWTAVFNRAASDRARGDDITEEASVVPRRLQRRVTQPHVLRRSTVADLQEPDTRRIPRISRVAWSRHA